MVAIRKKYAPSEDDQRDGETNDLAGLVRTGPLGLVHAIWFCPRAGKGKINGLSAASGRFDVQRTSATGPYAVPGGARIGRG